MADGSAQVTLRCGRCDKDKPRSAFARHVGTESGHQGECRQCHSEQNKAHYAANKDYYVQKAAESRARCLEAKVAFIEWIMPKHCAKCGCGVSIDNHRRLPKKGMTIADKSLKVMALHGWSRKRIDAEVAASVILCRGGCDGPERSPS